MNTTSQYIKKYLIKTNKNIIYAEYAFKISAFINFWANKHDKKNLSEDEFLHYLHFALKKNNIILKHKKEKSPEQKHQEVLNDFFADSSV
jgi:hypothetical protein